MSIINKSFLGYFHRQSCKMMRNDMQLFLDANPSLEEPLPGEKDWQDYWSRLGLKPSLVFYRVYSRFIGEDINIVPMDVSRCYIEPVLNPGNTISFYNDKNVFNQILDVNDLPKTILRNIHGRLYDGNYQPTKIDDLSRWLMDNGASGGVIVKSAKEFGGRGIKIFLPDNDGIFHDNIGCVLSFQYLTQNYGLDWLIQEKIRQSDFISQFNPTSVNTIRMNTYRDVITGEIHVLGAVLRIGLKNSTVDNASAGGVFVGVDSSGKLGKYTVNHNGEKKSVHNGIDFLNGTFCVPNYDLCKELAIRVSTKIPHMGLFAHDIALDSGNRPILIEVNTKDLTEYFLQTTSGPLFGDFSNDIIEYCQQYKNKIHIDFVSSL